MLGENQGKSKAKINLAEIMQKSDLLSPHFKEDAFKNLRWGLSIDEIESSFPEFNRAIQAAPGTYQILYYPFHNHIGHLSFHIGPKGLYMLTVSFIFRIKGEYLTQNYIVDESKEIFKELSLLYGDPEVSAPWHPVIRKFNYIWILKETYLQFAWDGADAWAVHFRSIELDPQAREIIKQIRSF
jgi:hypothetical protein